MATDDAGGDPHPRPARRDWRAVAAWTAVLGFHLALPSALSVRHELIPDEDAYIQLATRLARGGTYSLDFPSFYQAAGAPNTYFGPGWPLMLAAGYRVLGLQGFWLMLGLSWCLAAVGIDRLGRALGLGTRARWLLQGWLALNPILAYYHGHLMTEGLTLALGAWVLGLGVRLVGRPGPGTAALLGAISGYAHLTRTALMLPTLAVWIVAAAVVPPRRLLPLLLAFAAVHGAVLAPWLARMASHGAGWSSVERKLGHNLYTYNNIHVENPYRPAAGESYRYPEGLERLAPAERDALLRRLAVRGIVRRPGRYLKNCLRRAWYLLAPLPSFAEASPARMALLAASTAVFLYAPLALIAAALLRGARPDRGVAIVLTALALWYLFHILLHASIRQRIPADPWPMAAMLALRAHPRPGRVDG